MAIASNPACGMEPCRRDTHEGAESEQQGGQVESTQPRHAELRAFLEARRREVDESIRERLASFREERATADHVGGQDEGKYQRQVFRRTSSSLSCNCNARRWSESTLLLRD